MQQAVSIPTDRKAQEVDLVHRVQAREPEAFRELVERYRSKVHSAIFGILRNGEETEDIAQQVFTKIYFGIKSFDSRSSLFTWIYRITLNECYSHLRKRRSRMAHETGLLETETFHDESQWEDKTQSGTDAAVVRRDLANKLLASLPEDDRLLMILREVEDLSLDEIAAMTGRTVASVKIKLFRARQKLVKAAKRLSERPCAATGWLPSATGQGA